MNEGLEFRAAEVAGVSFPTRTVELVVMPYETETMIAEQGRVFTEIVSRSAFDGIESRNGKVRANRDHDVTRTVGRAVAFHPGRSEGLVAEIRISRTELGEETLVLADDGVLDASAGFAPMRGPDGRMVPGAEVWESRERRRLNRLYLGHIALTPEPAYETARVLAVRTEGLTTPPTGSSAAMPNRALLELQDWQRQLAAIDLRYSRE
jgi:phage head maturation protease